MNPPLFFQKLIMVAILPFIVVSVVVIIWTILKKYIEKQRLKKLGSEWRKKIFVLQQIIDKNDNVEREIAEMQLQKLIKESKYDSIGKIMSTLVILLFFLQPTIVEYSVSDFNCYQIDNQLRVKNDLTIICWSSVHYFFSLAVALPSLVCWGLGIPFFALILLIRNRGSLNTIETKEKLGFLYNGYKKEYYFWEILIMYRKILIIFIAIFLSN